jgi:hypothetical protein
MWDGLTDDNLLPPDFRYHKTDWDNVIPTKEYFNGCLI